MSLFEGWHGNLFLVGRGRLDRVFLSEGTDTGDDPGSGDPGDGGDDDGSTDPTSDGTHQDDGVHADHNDHFDRSLDTREGERMCRAAGRTSDVEAFERATSTNNDSSLADARAKEIQEMLRGLQQGESKAETNAIADAAAAEKPSLGERVSNWASDMVKTGFEKSVELMCEAADATKGLSDFTAGVDDFCNNYEQMKQNGGDKFYHCMANCQAAERGWTGVLAATCMSVAREATDVPKEILLSGYGVGDSFTHAYDDLIADYRGLRGGMNGTRCYDACKVYPHKQK